jgi:hypothetical protein
VVAPKTVETIVSRFPKLDFVLASWQPMLETCFQTNAGLPFPYARYSEVLYNLGLAAPRAMAPGANAFCYTRGAAWMNHVVFPVTKERFLHDAKSVMPYIGKNAFALEPADVLKIEKGECEVISAGSNFVKRTGYSADLTFAPVTVQAPLEDENPDEVSAAELEATVREIVESRLSDFIRKNENAFLVHRKNKVIYELEVVFQEKSLHWNIDFSALQPQVTPGRNSLANLFALITASSLHGMIAGARGWDYALLGGFCRNFHKLYSVTTAGIVRADWIETADPLRLLLPYQEIFEKVLDHEVQKWNLVKQAAIA